jgi:hypothetical protein
MSIEAIFAQLSTEINALIAFAETLKAQAIEKDKRIAELEAKLAAPIPAPTPASTIPPPPSSPDPVSPGSGDFQLVPKNMTNDGSIWKSTGDPLNCYLQWRTPRPIKWARIRVRRRTNVLPTNTATNGVNLKVLRDGPEYPNTYAGVGVKQGAWKLTTEHVAPKSATNDGQWPVLPYVSGQWIDETWEMNYEGKTFSHKVGAKAWAGSFDPGGITRTYIGVQCFVATDPRPVGLPASPFTEFEVLGFEWR